MSLTASQLDILARYRAGESTASIARNCNVQVRWVNRVIRKHIGEGVDAAKYAPKFDVDPMWTEMDDDERRAAIARRAAAGARKRLKAINRSLTMRRSVSDKKDVDASPDDACIGASISGVEL